MNVDQMDGRVVADDGRPAGAALVNQPAGVLSTWLEQLLRDVRKVHGLRLRELRIGLQAAAFEWDNATLARSIHSFHEAAARLDFAWLARRGLLARLMGTAASNRTRFNLQYRQILACSRECTELTDELARHYVSNTVAIRRLLVELDLECNALNRDIDQGMSWLASMRRDVADRLGSAEGDGGAKLQVLAQRADLLAQEYQRLQSTSAMARDVQLLGQNVLARRTELIDKIKVNLDGFNRVWKRWVGNLARQSGEAPFTAACVRHARDAHSELQKRLGLTDAFSASLQVEEGNFEHGLSVLRQALEASVPRAACCSGGAPAGRNLSAKGLPR